MLINYKHIHKLSMNCVYVSGCARVVCVRVCACLCDVEKCSNNKERILVVIFEKFTELHVEAELYKISHKLSFIIYFCLLTQVAKSFL
jgi:hypothetical protein